MEKHIYNVIDDTVKYNGQLLGKIYYDDETGKYRAVRTTRERPYTCLLWGLPPDIIDEQNNSDIVLHFLEERVVPPNRQGIKEALASLGIYEYNWKKMILLNHGRNSIDHVRVEPTENEHL